ncbi:MAG TPA: hypothetical protein VKW77_00255 [Acidimicrobiales bacterium]|nr:hypothetical protein [Acidimicrobiales bacterium]
MDLADARHQLYAEAPSAFVSARGELVRRARSAGDRSLADALRKLRRPTTSAWMVNLLARQRREEVDELLGLGRQLRSAQRDLAADELRRLSGRGHELVSALTRASGQLAEREGSRPSAGVLDEVRGTLEATLADPEAGEAVGDGALTEPLRYSGLGLELLGGAATTSRRASSRPRTSRRPARGSPATDAGAAEAAEAELAVAERDLEAAHREAKAAAEELEEVRRQVVEREAELLRLRNRGGQAKERLERARRAEQTAGAARDRAAASVERERR